MIDQERRSRKSHPGNPLHLSRIGVMSEAFQENPVFDHSRQARRFSAVGLWRQTPHHEVPAEATIAVADSVAKNRKTAKALARTALLEQSFDPAEITFERKDASKTLGAVDVVISRLG